MKIGVSLPADLLAFADEEAQRRGTTRSGLLARLLEAEQIQAQVRRYIDQHGWDVADNEGTWRQYQQARMAVTTTGEPLRRSNEPVRMSLSTTRWESGSVCVANPEALPLSWSDMSAAPSRWRGRRWIYVAAWLPFLTIYLTIFVANGMPLWLAVRGAIANVLPNALLGVVVLRLPRRLPWSEKRGPLFFTTHAALLIAFVLASGAGWMALVMLDGALFRGNVRIEYRLIPWRALNDLLVYCSLLGLGYAWHIAAAGRELAARAARAEALQARAELEAMRSQLNPHFILNTFHALVGLVRRDPAVAEEALVQLGDLLRYSLRIQREGLDEVTLRDEWAFVQSYLDLERLRLGDRLRVTFDAESGTLDCIVPSFALQTLVENSIRHAIAPRAAGGRLAVGARQAEDRLIIRVEDDGPGPGGAAPPGENHGVGLPLLRERLAALYGGRARLDLEAAPDGVAAVLDLPARHVQEGE